MTEPLPQQDSVPQTQVPPEPAPSAAETPTPVAPAAPAPVPVPAAPSGAKKILIVEDERPLAHALEMKLKHEGFAPEVVANGEDALNALEHATEYSLMLLDLIMPRVDGFTVLSEMKRRGIGIPPVMVLSNLGQEEDRRKAKELGAVNYFVKSNTPISEIVSAIKQALA